MLQKTFLKIECSKQLLQLNLLQGGRRHILPGPWRDRLTQYTTGTPLLLYYKAHDNITDGYIYKGEYANIMTYILCGSPERIQCVNSWTKLIFK